MSFALGWFLSRGRGQPFFALWRVEAKSNRYLFYFHFHTQTFATAGTEFITSLKHNTHVASTFTYGVVAFFCPQR